MFKLSDKTLHDEAEMRSFYESVGMSPATLKPPSGCAERVLLGTPERCRSPHNGAGEAREREGGLRRVLLCGAAAVGGRSGRQNCWFSDFPPRC